ncbi:MAG TPA: LPS export ABC transporter periplasmic protein LptC [Stellaceae bacterium]|nr:LPS export ABC transporter periplasmic protein LptC [Stellaceae bacterium]
MVSIPGPALRPERRLGRPAAGAGPADADHGRHSRRVALLKRVLPGIGVTLLLLIATWPRLAPLWERMRFAFPAINLRDARELDMIHPRYAGVDRNGHPFVVTAASGRQLPDREDLMSLKKPRADIKTHSGANIVVTADTGVYQSRTQILDLFGNVTLVHQNGTKFVTQSARVEVASNRAEGNQPVEGHGPSGNVAAQGFRVLDKGDKVLFTGRSDLLLKSVKPAAPKHPPAALPAPVAVAARQTEAEAQRFLSPVPRRSTAHRVTAHPRAGSPGHRIARHAPVRRRSPAAPDRG